MIEELLLVFAAFALGGILKGATGVGAPILAVPIMALLVDVPFAVAVFILPNIISNSLQGWRLRKHVTDRRLAIRFAAFGAVGAFMGTLALAGMKSEALTLAVGAIVLVYVAFRFINPEWSLARSIATKLSIPVGTFAGFLQGSIGLSSPVSITFMSAVGLPRLEFIPTMSLFFFAMGFAQLPGQIAFGIMTPERFVLSALATLPLVGFMPVGGYLARRVSPKVFDRILLGLLSVISLRLVAASIL